MNPTEGPFIQVACLCDTTIQDTSGVLSLIRIVDTIIHTEAQPNPPKDMAPFPHSFKLVIMLKSGAATGRHELRVVPELPDGSTENPLVTTVYFEGEEKGHNLVADMTFVFKLEGLWWFNVYIDETKLTAIPLRVKYNRVVMGTSPRPTAP